MVERAGNCLDNLAEHRAGMNRVPPIARRPARRATGTVARPAAAVGPAARVTGDGWPVLVGWWPRRTPTSATACPSACQCPPAGCRHACQRLQPRPISRFFPATPRLAGFPGTQRVVGSDRTMTAGRERAIRRTQTLATRQLPHTGTNRWRSSTSHDPAHRRAEGRSL